MDLIKEAPRVLFLGSLAHTRVDRDDPRSMSELIASDMFMEALNFSDADLVVFCDYQERDFHLLEKSGFPKKKCILIRVEPKPILPMNFDKEFNDLFGHVFNLGRTGNQPGLYFPWPQKWREPNSNAVKLDRFVMISGNKLSLVKGELYSLRRETLHSIQDIDLYGTGWAISRYLKMRILLSEFRKLIRIRETTNFNALKYWFRNPPNWNGAIDDKDEHLREYKYSIVIENSEEFLTEKLFDAFFAGSIPVYVGPDISSFHIPKDLAVQVSPTLNSIIEGIRLAKEIDYNKWLQSVEKWLTTRATFENWEVNHVYKKISLQIQELL
jgi:hypothetical protein